MSTQIKYNRVLLKLSGEAFLGDRDFGIDPKFVDRISDEIAEIQSLNVQVAIVIGSGNIFRGRAAEKNGMGRTTADYMGMLATVMNTLALKDSFERKKISSRAMSAIAMPEVCELYIRDRAIYQMNKGRIIIIGAGCGNPYSTTDTAAALRALELDCDIVLKATKVDGVYDSDPHKNQIAKKYQKISHFQALTDKLEVMDSTALSLCMENQMPILVFDLLEKGNIKKAIFGENIGTIVE
jgi:uridylate kinase